MDDKYAVLTELFMSNPKMKGWHPQMVYQTIKEMDERGQLFIYKPGNKIRAFTGWVYAGDEYEKPILEKKEIKFLNIGRNVFPMIWYSKLGLALNKKIWKKLLKIAKDRGGQVWSYRHNRIFKIGRA